MKIRESMFRSLMLLITAVPAIAQSDGRWTPWQAYPGVSGLQFRMNEKLSSQGSSRYSWMTRSWVHMEWRNVGPEQISFRGGVAAASVPPPKEGTFAFPWAYSLSPGEVDGTNRAGRFSTAFSFKTAGEQYKIYVINVKYPEREAREKEARRKKLEGQDLEEHYRQEQLRKQEEQVRSQHADRVVPARGQVREQEAARERGQREREEAALRRAQDVVARQQAHNELVMRNLETRLLGIRRRTRAALDGLAEIMDAYLQHDLDERLDDIEDDMRSNLERLAKSGEQPCSSCTGTGYENCADCSNGLVECDSFRCDSGSVPCLVCSGAGQIAGLICVTCGGTGDTVCSDCFGRGQTQCDECDAATLVECQTCDGEGIADGVDPECSGQEPRTAFPLAAALRAAGAGASRGIGGPGLIGQLPQRLRPDRPAARKHGCPAHPRTDGAAPRRHQRRHEYGHGVHMAVLSGTACYLDAHRDEWRAAGD